MKKYLSEMIGTMVLVLMGCGSAVMGGVDTLGIAFAFGLAVVAMAYTIGGISGCHINPAITLAMLLSGKISGRDAGMYMLFQIIGAIIGSAILFAIAGGDTTGANQLGSGVSMCSAFWAEFVFTFIFVLVVLGATSKSSPAGFAGLAIGLTLVLVHIVCIPLTGTSVNPARSIGPALFQGGEALSQLWLFIVAPMAGGALAPFVWKLIEVKQVK